MSGLVNKNKAREEPEMHKPTSKLDGTLAVLALVSATACMAQTEDSSIPLV